MSVFVKWAGSIIVLLVFTHSYAADAASRAVRGQCLAQGYCDTRLRCVVQAAIMCFVYLLGTKQRSSQYFYSIDGVLSDYLAVSDF